MRKATKLHKVLVISFILVPLGLLVAAIGFVIFSQVGFGNHGKRELQESFQSNPEVETILKNPNSEERQKAARAFAERVGVPDALEALYRSGLDFTGEGHLVVHQIGYVAWEKYGTKALLYCKDYFLYACYHGAVIEGAAKGKGFDTAVEMLDQCRGKVARFLQCSHAVGHAFLAMWNYALPQALANCDKLFENEKEIPGGAGYCYSGVFMENIFGVHDFDKGVNPKKAWLSDTDYYFPCNKVEQKYRTGCWENQATRILQLNGNDFANTATVCDSLESTLVDTCYNNIARQIHPLTASNPKSVFDYCSKLPGLRPNTCVLDNVAAYLSVGDPKSGMLICNAIDKSLQINCFGSVTGFMGQDDILSRDEKIKGCEAAIEPFANDCKTKIN